MRGAEGFLSRWLRGLPVQIDADTGEVEVGAEGDEEELVPIHRNHGHQPSLPCCDVCQSARGRIPARRKKMKTHAGPGELQVDFGFFGRNIRFLLIVHALSGYCAVLVLGPEDPVPHTSICKLLHEMGVGGLEVVCHIGERIILVNLEVRVGEQLPLGSELFAEAMRYSVRMHNLFHCGKEQMTPLERLRGSTVQPVKTFEFGVVGFGKPQKQYKEHRGKRLVRAIMLVRMVRMVLEFACLFP